MVRLNVVVGLAGALGAGIVVAHAEEVPWHPLDREAVRIEKQYLRFGPIWWKPRLELSGGVDSSPLFFAGFALKRDTVVVIRGRMNTAWMLGRMAILELEGSLGYQHYFHFDELRDTPWSWHAGAWLRLGPSAVHGTYGSEGSRYVQAPEIDLPIRTRWQEG